MKPLLFVVQAEGRRQDMAKRRVRQDKYNQFSFLSTIASSCLDESREKVTSQEQKQQINQRKRGICSGEWKIKLCSIFFFFLLLRYFSVFLFSFSPFKSILPSILISLCQPIPLSLPSFLSHLFSSPFQPHRFPMVYPEHSSIVVPFLTPLCQTPYSRRLLLCSDQL